MWAQCETSASRSVNMQVCWAASVAAAQSGGSAVTDGPASRQCEAVPMQR